MFHLCQLPISTISFHPTWCKTITSMRAKEVMQFQCSDRDHSLNDLKRSSSNNSHHIWINNSSSSSQHLIKVILTIVYTKQWAICHSKHQVNSIYNSLQIKTTICILNKSLHNLLITLSCKVCRNKIRLLFCNLKINDQTILHSNIFG